MSQILLATDLSTRAERAQRMALLIARETGSALKLVYAIDSDQPAAMVEAQRIQAESMLQRLMATIEKADQVACSAEVTTGSGVDAAIQAAVDRETMLIVLGSHRKRQIRDLFLGGTSERILARTDVPILVVRAAPVARYRRLLFATDLSDASMSAARKLAAHPVTAEASTTIVHLVGTEEQSPVAQNQMSDTGRDALMSNEQAMASQRLERFVERAGLDAVSRRVEIDSRPTATALIALASREGADLIALNPRRATGIESFLRYSVTTRLLNSSPVDLLLF
ncbi:universal stress protein [Spiribacter onubensis]|uniref:Universal stress protein n=1 Tax=Spiribacter onubensis TaxID=3122420 RepID=A0ABV3S9K1_9GAMM